MLLRRLLRHRRESRCRRSPQLALFLLTPLGSLHDLTCPVLVCGVIKKGANVVNEQRVELFCDLLLVCELKRAVIGNPINVSVNQQSCLIRSSRHTRHLSGA